jgi:hypothetical protein
MRTGPVHPVPASDPHRLSIRSAAICGARKRNAHIGVATALPAMGRGQLPHILALAADGRESTPRYRPVPPEGPESLVRRYHAEGRTLSQPEGRGKVGSRGPGVYLSPKNVPNARTITSKSSARRERQFEASTSQGEMFAMSGVEHGSHSVCCQHDARASARKLLDREVCARFPMILRPPGLYAGNRPIHLSRRWMCYCGIETSTAGCTFRYAAEPGNPDSSMVQSPIQRKRTTAGRKFEATTAPSRRLQEIHAGGYPTLRMSNSTHRQSDGR